MELKITKLNIENFRHLQNLENIEIGEKLTVIAGVNGTGKSSLLGLIGHVFSYREDSGKAKKAIDNRSLETLFSEVFRFSPQKELVNDYKYSIELQDGTLKPAQSRYIEANNRFRIDVGDRLKGEGKLPKPVLYLGLKRLIPLASENEKELNFNIINQLDDIEKDLFNIWHKEILVMQENVTPQPTKTRNKEVYLPSSEKYDAYGNSSGQDNVAQIILAILSIRREFERNKENYSGGLILIDELDATLYPAAQRNILDLFLKVCRDFQMQVIFTTHSIEMIDYMFNLKKQKYTSCSKLIFFYKPQGTIRITQEFNEVNKIFAELKHSVHKKPNNIVKINTYFEDDEARIFFKNIVKKKFLKYLNIQKNSLGADNYKNLIEHKFSEFSKSIIVLDGDQDKKVRNAKPKILILPGKTSPEKAVLKFLSDLDEANDFWACEVGGYNKFVFLNNKPTSNDRVVLKNWFNNEKQYWGRNSSKLFGNWKAMNKIAVEKFNSELEKFINKIYPNILTPNETNN